MEQSDIVWSRNHFRMLRDGAIWGVPRSGLNFRKHGHELILIARMPWFDEMRGIITPEELAVQQQTDYLSIKQHFEAAGIHVRDET